MKWGLIGCGDIAEKRVIPALKQLAGSELTAVSRADASKLSDCATRHDIAKTYANWRDICADEEIDAIYVATPVYLHAEQSIHAIEQGKHVLCEKPMAYNEREARHMIEAAKSMNVKLGIAYYRRFYPIVEKVRELLNGGRIGELVYAHCENCEKINPAPGQARRWLLQAEKSGGGPLMDMGCHRLDLFAYLFGDFESLSRVRMSRNVLKDRDVEDSAQVQIDFSSGLSADLFCSHAVAESRDSLDIYGSAGAIHIPQLNGQYLILSRPGEADEVFKLPGHDNVHLPLIEDFAQAITSERDPAVDGEQGLLSTIMLDQAYGR